MEINIRKVKNDSEMKSIHLDWANSEGWNPGCHDHIVFYHTDPNGFLVCTVDNEPAACISLVNYDESFAFLGYYIVAPKFRHQGYGLRIWEAAIDRAAKRTIGLDGVVAQQDNYKRSGFEYRFTSRRYLLNQVPSIQTKSSTQCTYVLARNFNELALAQYDATHAGVFRPKFLKHFMNQPDTHALVAFSKKTNQINGLGVIRRSISGYRCGPLFADTSDIASNLFKLLSDQVPVSKKIPIYLDVPTNNSAAMTLVKQQSMQPGCECARMIKPGIGNNKIFDLPKSQIFGITSWELG